MLSGDHLRVCLYYVEGEVQGVELQHHLIPPFAGVEREYLGPLSSEAAEELRGPWVSLGVPGCEDVLALEVGPYLHQ